MKKLALYTALGVLAVASGVEAKCNYNGFYAGVGPSYNMMGGRQRVTAHLVVAGTEAYQFNGLGAKGNATCTAWLGYGTNVVNPYTYLGIEAVGDFGTVQSKFRNISAASNGSGYISTVKRNSAGGAGLRIGLLAHNNLYYARFGFESCKFTHHFADLSNAAGSLGWYNFNVRKSRTGFAPAIGVETRMMHKRIALRGEVAFTTFQKWAHTTQRPLTTPQTTIHRIRPNTFRATLGIGYSF